MKRIIGTLAITAVLASSTTLYAQEGVVSTDDSTEAVTIISADVVQETPVEKVSVIGADSSIDLTIEYVDGVAYIPLRDTLETLGYTVTWNGEDSSIDIQQGAIFTTVILENNRYFSNKIAPWTLSGAPTLIDGSTYVPVEFFADVLNVAESVDEGVLTLDTNEWGRESGYVTSITYNEDGGMRMVISEDPDAEEPVEVIVNTEASKTIVQKDIQEGDYIKVITSPYMIMIYPKTITAYVVY